MECIHRLTLPTELPESQSDCLDGQRLYQLVVVVPSGSSSTDIDDFMNSFRIQ
jgi:hypothetical protein